MKVFDNQDCEYLDWLTKHPNGYVLNRYRYKSDGYLILHKADCEKIRSYNKMAQPGGFTSRSYIKVCADTISDLEDYVRTNGGRPDGTFTRRCSKCGP